MTLFWLILIFGGAFDDHIVLATTCPNSGNEYDKEEFAEAGGSVSLQCGSVGEDAVVVWYYTADTVIVGHNLETDTEPVYPNEDNYPRTKYIYSDVDHSLTVLNVELEDENCFKCTATIPNSITTTLATLIVRPQAPSFTVFPTFKENTDTSVLCKVSSAKPGKESLQFSVNVDPDFSVESLDSELSEEEVEPNTGAVSVTYTTVIRLQRKHNGQDTVCDIEWRGETFTSNTRQATVEFKASQVTMDGEPTDLVEENTDITVVCRTDEGNPTPTVSWYRDGQTVPVDSVLETVTNTQTSGGLYNGKVRVSTLKIKADRTLNGKVYRCEVEDTNLEESFELEVAYVQPPLRLSGNPSTSSPVSEGDSVQFTCLLDANPTPSYSIWTSDDGTQQKWTDLGEGQDTITLTLERQHNRVGLFCRAEGSLDEYPLDSDLKTYTVQFNASSITMTQSPSGPVSENTKETFICVTDEAEPTADVMWTVGGNSVSSTSDTIGDGMYNTETRTSVLELTLDKTMNGKEVVCYVNKNSAVRDKVTLDVIFPHNVAIMQNPSDSVLEGSRLTLTCEASGGNPPEVLSYSWGFVPRYEESSDLSSDTDRELEFDSVEYRQAGVYRCEVANGGGVNNDSREVLVQFSPIDVSSPLQKLTYTEVNKKALLNCTVRAYPAVTTDHVDVMFEGSKISSNNITVQALVDEVDETLIELTFDPVTAEDFGLYQVVLNNGTADKVVVKLNLSEQGVPQAPHSLMIVSVTAISMTVSWLGGRNGGSPQTFTITYQKESASTSQTIADIADPGAGLNVTYTITGLKAETDYTVNIIAKNMIDNSATSLSVSNRTLDLPLVHGDLVALVSDKDVKFSWESLEGTYTRVVILKCTPDCTVIHEVTDPQATSAEVSGVHSEGAEYRLVFYQGDVVVNEKYFAIQGPTDKPTPVAIIAAVCAIVVVLVIVLIVGAVLFIRRKNKKGPKDLPVDINDIRLEGNNAGATGFAEYADVDKSKKRKKKDKNEKGADVDMSKKKQKKDKKSKAPDESLLYAEVDKSKKKGKQNAVLGAEGPVEYAGVDMSKKKQKKDKKSKIAEGNTEYADVDMSKKKQKKQKKSKAGDNGLLYAEVDKSKKKGKQNAAGDVGMMYANVGDLQQPEACEYENVNRKDDAQTPEDTGRYITDEGLTYAAVAFNNAPANPPVGAEPVIIGDENRVIYDAVDFTKTAPNLV